MKFHILRTLGFSYSEFKKIFDYINSLNLNIKVVSKEVENIEIGLLLIPHISFIFDKIEMNKQQAQNLSNIQIGFIKGLLFSDRSYRIYKYVEWSRIFKMAISYRNIFDVNSEDFVVILTNEKNELNWFGGLDENSPNNIFISVSEWEFFLPKTSSIYPIAYEMFAFALRSRLLHLSNSDLIKGFHKKAIGCMNDFCQDKHEIVFKLRTGDICASCMKNMIKAGVSKKELLNSLKVFETIRKHFLFSQGFINTIGISPLLIDSEFRLLLTEYDNIEIPLTPLEKSIYILLLNNPQGIESNAIQNHKLFLRKWYLIISPRINIKSMEGSIESLWNDDRLKINISRINRKIKQVLNIIDDEFIKHYLIKNVKGKRLISIDRNLITYPKIG